jgi:hypothetical protein
MHFYVLLLAAQSTPPPEIYRLLLYWPIIVVVFIPIWCWIQGQVDGWNGSIGDSQRHQGRAWMAQSLLFFGDASD